MTVETTARKQSFSGGQSTLTYSFRSLEDYPEYIKVLVTTGGTETLLTYDVDYTVTPAADGIGGVVTVSPSYSTLYTYTVYRETDLKQESDYDDYNQFPADTLEEDLDRVMLLAQESGEDTDRNITVAISSTITGSSLQIVPLASNIIGWNSAGTALTNYTANSVANTLQNVFDNGQTIAMTGTKNLAITNSGTGTSIGVTQSGAGTSLYITKNAVLGSSKHAIQVYTNQADTTADTGLVKFQQDNAGASEPIIEIINAGTGAGIELLQSGTGTGLYITKNAVLGSSKHAIHVYTNQADTTADTALIKLEQDHAGASEPVIEINNDGLGAGLEIDADGSHGTTKVVGIIIDVDNADTGDQVALDIDQVDEAKSYFARFNATTAWTSSKNPESDTEAGWVKIMVGTTAYFMPYYAAS